MNAWDQIAERAEGEGVVAWHARQTLKQRMRADRRFERKLHAALQAPRRPALTSSATNRRLRYQAGLKALQRAARAEQTARSDVATCRVELLKEEPALGLNPGLLDRAEAALREIQLKRVTRLNHETCRLERIVPPAPAHYRRQAPREVQVKRALRDVRWAHRQLAKLGPVYARP